MAPIKNRPFLEYQLDYWIAQGVDHFVLSVGYRHEVIVEHFGNSYRGVKLDYSIEQAPLGTGGALLLAAEKIACDIPFLLLNGDTFFTVDLKILDKFCQAHNADWCFSLFRAEEEGRYMGIEVSSQGRINSLNSGMGQRGRLANGGVYWVHPRALFGGRFTSRQGISLENDIFPAAMASGQKLFGVEFPGIFIDIGVPDDYRRASTVLTG